MYFMAITDILEVFWVVWNIFYQEKTNVENSRLKVKTQQGKRMDITMERSIKAKKLKVIEGE